MRRLAVWIGVATAILAGSGARPCGASLWAVSLMVLDRATGAATAVGAPAQPVAILGLAHDRASDTLFGASATHLWVVDQGTGQLSPVGPHGLPQAAFEVDLGLEIDPLTGELFAIDESGVLYRLDRSTGAATAIGPLPQAASGLAALPAAVVPALGPAAVALLGLALAGAGAFALRRV